MVLVKRMRYGIGRVRTTLLRLDLFGQWLTPSKERKILACSYLLSHDILQGQLGVGRVPLTSWSILLSP